LLSWKQLNGDDMCIGLGYVWCLRAFLDLSATCHLTADVNAY